MAHGFFSVDSVLSKAPPALLPRCGQCGLYKHCQSPKMVPHGRGARRILLLGEAPAREEDSQGRPFVGQSGQLLRKVLQTCGIDMDQDCWTTNSIICRSSDAKDSNRTPTVKEIDYCRPNLIRTIQELQPEVIIPLGASAVRSLLAWLWREDVGTIGRWLGWQIPNQRLNLWICPTWHPAAILRNDRGQGNGVMELLFARHLRRAGKLRGRPWQQLPDYRQQLRIFLDVDNASLLIRKLIEAGKPTAIDIETDRLKPDRTDARIICCALSNGEETIAYPWHGECIRATREFIESNVPKVGYNVKFESRWFLARLGVRIRNWLWDGMLAAHVLDNRPMVTSLKFQACVRLGIDPYDEHVKPFLQSTGSNERNRIQELSLDKLLFYNALDALLEHKIALLQMKEMGIEHENHS